MTALETQLASYAEYHRDERNVATHMAGIPLIVLAVEVLLSRPIVPFGDAVTVTPAMAASLLAALFYLRLDVRFGLAMTALLAAGTWFGLAVARGSTGLWLAVGVGGFLIGWALQFLGHHYEGRKPAFLDDVRGLIVGPLFVVAEAAFALGLRPEVRASMRRR